MFYLASTRFINSTYIENITYREQSNEFAIYGTLIKIQYKYTIGSTMFVIEMNNETNTIEGIGLITNKVMYDKHYPIYKNDDYNRYVYKGDYWISCENIRRFDPTIIEICDLILFKGKSHLKRQTGITVLTEKLFSNWPLYKLNVLKNSIKTLFISTFRKLSVQLIDNADKEDECVDKKEEKEDEEKEDKEKEDDKKEDEEKEDKLTNI